MKYQVGIPMTCSNALMQPLASLLNERTCVLKKSSRSAVRFVNAKSFWVFDKSTLQAYIRVTS